MSKLTNLAAALGVGFLVAGAGVVSSTDDADAGEPKVKNCYTKLDRRGDCNNRETCKWVKDSGDREDLVRISPPKCVGENGEAGRLKYDQNGEGQVMQLFNHHRKDPGAFEQKTEDIIGRRLKIDQEWEKEVNPDGEPAPVPAFENTQA